LKLLRTFKVSVAVGDQRQKKRYDKNELLPAHKLSPKKCDADTLCCGGCTPPLLGFGLEDFGTK
jgi:hypothetical protein